MPVFTKDSVNILYIHIPKAGGTTIENIFKNNGYSWSYRTRAGNLLNRVTLCTPQHMHGDMLQSVFDISKFDFVFTVVRDPYARIRSEYAMRTKDPKKVVSNYVNAWIERKFREYGVNKFVNDNHIRPQHEYLVDGVKIYHLEDGIESIIRDIESALGVEIACDNNKRHMSSVAGSGYSSSDVELDDWARERVREFYNLDFELFGYPK